MAKDQTPTSDAGDSDTRGLTDLNLGIVSIWSEQTVIPLVFHQLDGTIVYANNACSQLLNRSPDDIISFPIEEHFGEEWYALHRELTDGATPEEHTFSTQLRFIVDEEDRIYGINSEILFTDVGDPQLVFLTLKDVTAQAQAQAELQRANQALSESNRDLEEFAYVASHDLQEPLRKIQAFGERLQGRLDGLEDQRALDYLERMQGASGRMQVCLLYTSPSPRDS